MIAIETRYHGPTNYRPSRVSARWLSAVDGSDHQMALTWDAGESARANGARVLREFLRLEAVGAEWAAWSDPATWVAGETARGFVWVWVSAVAP